MTTKKIKDWLEDNNIRNSALEIDDNHRVSLYLSDVLEQYHESLVTLGLPSVSGCKHENETMRQGNGFTYSVCSDCGADL